MMVIRLSTLAPAAFTPQEILPVLISIKRLSRSQGHSAAGRIKSIKNSNNTIGNRTRLVAQYPNQPRSPCSMEFVVIRLSNRLPLRSFLSDLIFHYFSSTLLCEPQVFDKQQFPYFYSDRESVLSKVSDSTVWRILERYNFKNAEYQNNF